jgi:hypothetical protein
MARLYLFLWVRDKCIVNSTWVITFTESPRWKKRHGCEEFYPAFVYNMKVLESEGALE